ncbi:MAG: hypothetical protein M1820_010174 [Bogoriella megaspora]|nr:MAG: hypothetical protein M1820_010174 [Bogoriella megaspora]
MAALVPAAPTGNGIKWDETKPVDFAKSIDKSTLKGQSVLVTGGANGIGAGIVRELAEAGAYVTSIDLNEDMGQQVVDELKAEGLHAQFLKVDVTSWDAQRVAFRSALEFAPHKALDIVIPSAGLDSNNISDWLNSVPITTPDDELKPYPSRTVEVNFLGTYYSTQLALHFFRFPPQPTNGTPAPNVQSKQLIFLASLAAYGELHRSLDYGSSKQGVRGLWYALKRVTGILGYPEKEGALPFRTNMIAPWFVKTNIINRLVDSLEQHGVRIAGVPDVTDGIMRCLCDEEVVGRAIVIAPGGKDGNNFDICDEHETGAGMHELLKRSASGSGLLQTELILHMQGKPKPA